LGKIRNLTNVWAKTTYSKMLSVTRMQNRLKEKLKQILLDLGIFNHRIVGESITGLEKTSEVGLRSGISYAQAFDLAFNENPKKLPIIYLKQIVVNSEGYNRNKLRGIIARGLRTLPSLLRDRDFAEKLKEMIPQFFPNTKFDISLNPGIDTKEHTDVFLKLRGEIYRIWLYQFTRRGLPHDTERILGKRGELPDGFHILCPIVTEVIMEKEKLMRRKNLLESRIDRYRKKYENYRNKESKGAKKCLKKIEEYKDDLKDVNLKLRRITPLADSEAISLNGWYFYSDKKIENLLTELYMVMIGKNAPDPYSKVYRILSGPEKYLSSIRIFVK